MNNVGAEANHVAVVGIGIDVETDGDEKKCSCQQHERPLIIERHDESDADGKKAGSRGGLSDAARRPQNLVFANDDEQIREFLVLQVDGVADLTDSDVMV